MSKGEVVIKRALESYTYYNRIFFLNLNFSEFAIINFEYKLRDESETSLSVSLHTLYIHLDLFSLSPLEFFLKLR